MTIPFEMLAIVDSTSSEAMRRLQAGSRAPFAVAAHAQTAGRGRRGRQWLGERGNVYLTIAIAEQSATPRELATWPLRFAALVCGFLFEELGLVASLKWPNDIYVDGKKLAGVLGESVMQGDSLQAIVMGLGINVNHTPTLPLEADAVCLAELGHPSPTAAELCQKIMIAFSRDWTEYRDKPVSSVFDACGLPQGQLWGVPGDTPIPQLVSYAYDDDGGLLLSGLNNGPPARFVSADHDQKWLYDARHRNGLPFVTLDVGNTSAKLTRFDKNTVQKATIGSECDLWQSLLLGLPQGWPIYCVSVNKPLYDSVSSSVSSLGFRLFPVPKKPVRLRHGAYDLAQLGIDRLAAMEGFLVSPWATAKAAIVISAGTATTIDLLAPGGVHLGGYIMPGIAMGLDAMHEHTNQLPKLGVGGELPVLATDTKTAMLGGMRLAIQGAATLALRELRSRLSPEAEITSVATGGGAHALFPDWIDENLVAKGIRAMVFR